MASDLSTCIARVVAEQPGVTKVEPVRHELDGKAFFFFRQRTVTEGVSYWFGEAYAAQLTVRQTNGGAGHIYNGNVKTYYHLTAEEMRAFHALGSEINRAAAEQCGVRELTTAELDCTVFASSTCRSALRSQAAAP